MTRPRKSLRKRNSPKIVILDEISVGGFSVVWSGKTNGRSVAVKQMEAYDEEASERRD